MSRSDMQREPGIIAGPCDEFAKTVIRNTRAGVLRNGMNNLGLAALNQYPGDRLADGPALRDGMKMTLAPGTGVENEI